MHSVPVPGPPELIRQNQRKTLVVESLQNAKFCKLAVTDVLRLDCSRKCLTSQELEYLFKVCLSSSLALYLCNLSLDLVHIQLSYLAS